MSRLQRRRVLAIEKRRAAAYIGAAVCLLVWLLLSAAPREDALPVSTAGTGSSNIFWRSVIYTAVPSLEACQTADNLENSFYSGVRDMIYFMTCVRPDDLGSILSAELAIRPPELPAAALRRPVKQPPPKVQTPFKGGQTLVGIYHTHTAESFVPTSGRTHSPGGQRGEIVAVGKALAERLQTSGIAVVHSQTIHDYPSFMRAYGASEQTVQQMMAENPALEYIFDIHRDAAARSEVITEINGQTIASISIIVAQGRDGLEQPHWQENYAAALRLKEKCDELYPGLIRAVQFAEWRYNEHLHHALLLLEVGSHETSAAEAVQAIEYFGAALAEVIRQSN